MDLVILTDKNFQEEVVKSELPVVVDYWAPWCAPCKALSPIIEEIAREYRKKVKVAKLNIDENRNIPAHYGIMSIPTLMFFKGGKVIGQATGVVAKQQLKQKIEELI